MNFLKNVKKIVYRFDLFSSSQFLKLNQEGQYKTITGSLLSLGIIIAIIIGFASMIIDTLNKTSISSSLTTIKQSDPPLSFLVPNKENNFMFAISIASLDLMYNVNLSSTPKYFDIQMSLSQVSYGVPNFTQIPLQQCTQQHWAMVPNIYDHFDTTGASAWLCLPLNYQLPLKGAFSSVVSDQVVIYVYSCTNTTSNDTCASQQDIDSLFAAYQNFYLSIMYVNPAINADRSIFMSYYLQADDYVIFSKDIGSQAWIYFSDYTINTDYSIWPYSNIETTTGSIVENKAINHPYNSNNHIYATIFLAKSSNSLVYDRQVQKISAVFSFIGGLVGAVTALLFLIKSYTETSLEVHIGRKLYSAKINGDKSKEEKSNFSIFQFTKLIIYRILKYLKWDGQWTLAQKLTKYQEEAKEQLDVCLLLKRITMLQSCLITLHTREKLERINDNEGQTTLRNAKSMRTIFIKNKFQLENKIIQEQLNQQLNRVQLNNQNVGIFLSPYEASKPNSQFRQRRQNVEEMNNEMQDKSQTQVGKISSNVRLMSSKKRRNRLNINKIENIANCQLE